MNLKKPFTSLIGTELYLKLFCAQSRQSSFNQSFGKHTIVSMVQKLFRKMKNSLNKLYFKVVQNLYQLVSFVFIISKPCIRLESSYASGSLNRVSFNHNKLTIRKKWVESFKSKSVFWSFFNKRRLSKHFCNRIQQRRDFFRVCLVWVRG